MSRERFVPKTSQTNTAASTGDGAAGGRTRAENPLSEREMDVAHLLVTGVSNAEIARELVISPHTVKVHLRNIYEKLQVSSRTEASTLLLQQGWVTLPGVEVAGPEEAPEPAALADGVGPMLPWQRVYLVAAIVLAFLSFLLPSVLQSQDGSLPTLLTDGQATTLGQPVVAALPRWESRTPLPQPRDRFALVPLNDNKLVAIGGETSQGRLLADVDAYDLTVNEWRPLAPLPVPLSNVSAVALDNHLYVAGGTTATEGGQRQVSDALWRYTPDENRWEAMGRLPAPLAGAVLVAGDEALYLIGGWDGQGVRSEVWRIEPAAHVPIDSEAWQLVTTMPGGRAFLGAASVATAIYIAGGYDGERELAEALVFDTTAGVWQELPPLSTPRSGLALLYDGLALFALGGGWTEPVDTLERYDPATGLWSNAPVPIAGEWRNVGAAASSRGQLYLMGGWSGGYLNHHLQYQSSFRTFLPATKKSN